MSETLTYTVPGRPVTWARTNEVAGRRVTDKAQKQAKAVHALHATLAKRGQPWDLSGAFAIDVVGYYPSAVTGDTDRLASLALDALQCSKRCKHGHNGVLWHDDRQVRDVRSRIVADGSPPRTIVTVRRISETVAPKRGRAGATLTQATLSKPAATRRRP
jgi:hypothetical protein